MKQVLRLLTLVVILSSCTQSNQKKAEKAVTNYIKSHIGDPASYEPVSFDTLKRDFAIGKWQKNINNYNDSAKHYDSLYEVDNKKEDFITARFDLDMSKIFSKGVKDFSEFKDSACPYGWVIHHKFRGKNAMGALVLNEFDYNVSEHFDSVNKEPVK